MQRAFRIMAALVILAMALPVPAGAQTGFETLEPLEPAPSAETGELTNETPSLWFVELSGSPTSDGGSLNTTQGEKASFRSEANSAGLRFVERFSYDTLWNGLAVSVAPSQLNKLYQISGVKAIYPVISVALPASSPVESPELATALAMTGADIAHSSLGLSGEGVRVAVMDTGIDYHHPDLGGCFGRGCRVVTGFDFVGDAFNADPASATYNPVAAPDPDPDDCNGHGTHVAGIVGAEGAVVGVAPGVKFGAYRVFGCDGSTTADIMLAAMERALHDRMDVLNMSIGSAYQWPEYPTAKASDRLVKKGMVVVASIGNSGATGLYSTGAPGVGERVIGVASFDNTHVALPTFTVSPDNTSIGYTSATGAPPAPTSGSLPMTRTGTATTVDDACAALAPGSLTGFAVLIRRGTCSFYQKAFNAQSAGAAAVVLYNNVAGRINPTVAGTPAITIPVVSISDTEGVLIDSRLASGPVDMTWTTVLGTFPNPTGGLISSFSSYGLSPDLTLKPDIGAPGGLIRSTYPIERGSYATISGTSMASPHVAGAVALYLEEHPRTKAGDMRAILQNTADPHLWWGNPGLGFLDNVHRQGAGMVDIDDAILSTVFIEPGKLAVGESAAGPVTRRLKIENDGSSTITLDVTHVPALATGPNTFVPSFSNAPAAVTFSTTTLTIHRHRSATVDVTITANPDLPDQSQYGGYIMFTEQGSGKVYSVPYAGFKGDYQSIPVLTLAGFPRLAKLDPAPACQVLVPAAACYINQPGGATYTLQGSDVPYILVHLNHQVERLELEIHDPATGQPIHPFFNNAVELEFVGRNSTTTGFFAYPWDGTRIFSFGRFERVRNVPDGQYVLVLKVLKALGDRRNPAHWETWTSPVITLDRP